MTLSAFIAKNRVRMTADYAESNPNMEQAFNGARHFRCTLKVSRKQMSLFFSQGSAHTSEPTAKDVLDCLASDASGLDNARGFEDWADEYGYSSDSRAAERTYRTVQKQAESLKNLLGSDAYSALLYSTERL